MPEPSTGEAHFGARQNMTTSGFRAGAVGIVDALGFRGIWRKSKSGEVLAMLRAIKGSALSDAALLNQLISQGITVRCVFFSDSLIVTAERSPEGLEVSDSELVAHVGIIVQGVISRALSGPHRLVYRGCIAFGDIDSEHEFFVGPAIDEAAAWYERANAAVVWLLPSAGQVIDSQFPSPEFFVWDVPIKGEGKLRAWVVDPYGRLDAEQLPGIPVGLRPSPAELRRRMLDYFDATRVDVMIKKEETARLL
ncbi:MAG: hypothetical protein ABI627_03230, partial [Polyangiaceae bacterium]